MQLTTASTERQRHILLAVDDQPLNILLLNEAFSADYQVLKASSGADALQVCLQQRPDLILLDVVMPGMDGFEVCRRLKADPLTRDIPVIFVTAHDDPGSEALGLELGAVDFIVKPINVAVVRARVKTHLGFARSTSLLAATLEASTDGILVTDEAGGISSMNRAFIQMWGLPANLLAATACSDLFAFMQRQLRPAGHDGTETAKALRQRDPCDACELLELADNRYIERYVTPLHINGSLHGQVLIYREVTERRRAADVLLRLNESLESRILERTQALESATRLAQAASHAKSDFLSNMSHEIRTPMNAIVGLAYLALNGGAAQNQRNCLEKIHLSGQHLLGLVNDVLDFSKIEAGRLLLEETDFHLTSVFDSVANVSGEMAKAKGLSLNVDIDPSLLRASRGDPLRLGQVLLNFVGNAIKFTAQGGVQVRARTLQRFETESLIRIEVEDTGIGLSDAQIAQLFQSFHQVDTSTTRNFDGTGLGLALCKRLAELMGGEVGVSSRPGQGSVFWFTSRLRFGAPVAAGVAAAAVRESREVLRGARILIVEDNLLNQEVAAGLIEAVGATVVIANHGQEALTCLQAERFDAVLMDIQMPVMDGLQATRLIRQNPLFADLPVLAMTANARSEDGARCLEAGMNDFLTKPVLPARLYAALAQCLAPHAAHVPAGGGAQAAAPAPAPAPAVGLPAGDPNIIDLSILSQQVDGDLQKARRYGALFVQTMPGSMAELEAALGQGNLSTLAELGHRMKSSARLVGALGLASLCESLEGFRRGGTLGDAQLIVEKMPPLMARISADFTAAMS